MAGDHLATGGLAGLVGVEAAVDLVAARQQRGQPGGVRTDSRGREAEAGSSQWCILAPGVITRQSYDRYGEEMIQALSDRLSAEFGRGFSKRNLDYMRAFYLAYQDRAPMVQSVIAQFTDPGKTQSVIAPSNPGTMLRASTDEPSGLMARPFSLSWTHYLVLLSIKNSDERSFYEIEAAEQNWTVRELKRQFDSSLYERLALSRDKTGIWKLASEG